MANLWYDKPKTSPEQVPLSCPTWVETEHIRYKSMAVIFNIKIGRMRTEEEDNGHVQVSYRMSAELDLVYGTCFPIYIGKINYFSKESLHPCIHPL